MIVAIKTKIEANSAFIIRHRSLTLSAKLKSGGQKKDAACDRRKEWPNMENSLYKRRIFSIYIYKSQFHLCGPLEQIIRYNHKESHSCLRKQMRDKRVQVV
jgi:hypothetical protein